MSAAPLVTVGLSAYNAGDALASAIQSVLRQSYGNWELILIDDGSTDNTLAIMQGFEDSRIRVIADGKNRGVAVRMNQAFDLAKGKYFARMDQDDIAYPERLETQVTFLEQHADIDLLGARALVFWNDGSVIGLYPFRRTHAEICAKPWLGFYFAQPTWMGKIEWFRHHRYRIPEVFRAEDQDLLLRTHSSSRFACLPEVLLGYRQTALPLRKVLIARKHLAFAQWSVNFQQGRVAHAALGFGAFALKALFDIVIGIAGAKTLFVRRLARTAPQAEIDRWRKVWLDLNLPSCDALSSPNAVRITH